MPAPVDSDPVHRDDGHHGQWQANERTRAGSGWDVPVLPTTATTGAGVAELVATIDRHRAHLQASGGWAIRERARSQGEIEHLLRDRFIDEMVARVPAAERDALITAVAERRLDPYSAADQLFAGAGPC
jgi:LAO/AO transport system kinase